MAISITKETPKLKIILCFTARTHTFHYFCHLSTFIYHAVISLHFKAKHQQVRKNTLLSFFFNFYSLPLCASVTFDTDPDRPYFGISVFTFSSFLPCYFIIILRFFYQTEAPVVWFSRFNKPLGLFHIRSDFLPTIHFPKTTFF